MRWCSQWLARAEETIARVTKSGQNVTVFVEFAIEARGEHRNIRVRARESLHAFGSGY